MQIIKPDYFEQFECTADKCKDTCCAGWQIVVDKESLKKYKKINDPYVCMLMACIDWETETFRQDKNKRCAFLNEKNLCDMYCHLGKDSLCKTCREYPRHTEEFEGVREISLSISCPEVARILMERETPVTFIQQEDENWKETEDFEDFDPFFYSILESAREEMIRILQDRTLPLQERAMLVLGMAHDMQGRINRQEMFACEDVIRKYTREPARKYVKSYLERSSTSLGDTFSNIHSTEAERSKEMFQKLYELEVLREDWNTILQESQQILFGETLENFDLHKRAFTDWMKVNAQTEIQLEQILVYFLFTYFPGAVYDGNVFAKAQMAVYCTWMIKLLWMARWLSNEKQLNIEEMTELIYRFSRETEHSDNNLQRLDKIMEKKWLI